MTDWFIPDSWLAAIGGKGLLYPCAGNDWAEPIQIFGDYVDDFVFSDLHYPQGMKLEVVSRTEFKRTYSRIEGSQDAVMEERRHGNLCFRHLEPSVLVERYMREIDGRAITVKRRRGFGQYAIQEQPEHSLGIFMHRGDSPGESGSNVYFLANKTARHGP